VSAVLVGALAVVSAQSAADAPAYNAAGELQRPANYREWVFLSAGLDMTYGPAAAALDANRNQLFNNVFVPREAYRAFKATGAWPDKTMFILEVRRAEANVSINNRGRTQGSIAAIEAAVKDEARYAGKEKGGWAYFSFGDGSAATAAPLGPERQCNACHAANTAVENTFVQFYPELFAIAQAKGTIKASYDPNRKP
jgi:hypothetical protein